MAPRFNVSTLQMKFRLLKKSKSSPNRAAGDGGVSPPKRFLRGPRIFGRLAFFEQSSYCKYLFSMKKLTKILWIVAILISLLSYETPALTCWMHLFS